MKRALVLSGGGARGAFEVGALEYLVLREKLDFRIFIGTSVGALNAAFLGQAHSYRELVILIRRLKEFWLGIKGNSSVYSRRIFGFLSLFYKDSFYQPKALQRLIRREIDPDRIFNPATVVKVSTVAVETGELFYANSRHPELRETFLDYVLASASMPLFFPAAPIAGKHWYDGGLRDMTPLGAAFEEAPDEILVIITYPIGDYFNPRLPEKKHGGALNAILRAIEILTSEIAANDLQLADAVNRYHWIWPKRRRLPIRLIAPSRPLAGSHALDFSPEAIRENMNHGYEAAQSLRLLGSRSSGYLQCFTK